MRPGGGNRLAHELLLFLRVFDLVRQKQVQLGQVARFGGGPLHHDARYGADVLREICFGLGELGRAEALRGGTSGAPLSSLATRMVPPSVEDSFPRTVPTPAQQDDPATVSRVIADLAAHIGPIAEKLVRSELRKGASLPQVVEKMGAEIADEEIRAAFLQKFALPKAKSAALSPSGPKPRHAATGSNPAFHKDASKSAFAPVK